MIKGEEKQRGQWKIRVVSELYLGKDNEIQRVQIKTSIGFLNQPIQLLYPLELHCNNDRTNAYEERNVTKKLNIKATKKLSINCISTNSRYGK